MRRFEEQIKVTGSSFEFESLAVVSGLDGRF